MNKINDANLTEFESSQTFTSVTEIFNENSVQNSSSNEFDQSIEKIDFISKKIDFADEKLTNFSNIKSKNSEFYQNNNEFKRCVKKQRKIHKLCSKLSKIESKSIESKIFERVKSLQQFYKLEFEFKRK